MSRKVLGRGLSALLGEESIDMSGGELLELDLDLIEPNTEQPRTKFTDDGLEDLAQSIRVNGIVQPIIVRRKGSKFQLVAGERRWRASQKAGLQKIPAIVKEVADEKLLELALIENIQRQELNAVEEARAYRNLIEKLGLTQEMIAERVGKNRTIITTYLRLLKLPQDIQKLVEDEKISAGHARALLMTNDEQKYLLFYECSSQALIVFTRAVKLQVASANAAEGELPNEPSTSQSKPRKRDPRG